MMAGDSGGRKMAAEIPRTSEPEKRRRARHCGGSQRWGIAPAAQGAIINDGGAEKYFFRM